MVTFATGGNFEITLTHGIAVCRIWMRPDVTREQGAAFAQQKIALLSDLSRRPRLVAKGLLLDMRQAPPKWGPITQSALDQIFAAWETAGRHIAVLACADPIQTMILRQTFKLAAPTCGRIFPADEQAAAESWCRLAPTPPAAK